MRIDDPRIKKFLFKLGVLSDEFDIYDLESNNPVRFESIFITGFIKNDPFRIEIVQYKISNPELKIKSTTKCTGIILRLWEKCTS